jgi:hypothetical protein
MLADRFRDVFKLGIGSRLSEPSDTMVSLYGTTAIEAIRYSTYFFAGIVGCLWIPTLGIWLAREFCTIQVVEFDL